MHYTQTAQAQQQDLFKTIAGIGDKGNITAALVRPSGDSKNLQVLPLATGKSSYREVNEKLAFITPARDQSAAIAAFKPGEKSFRIDAASVIVSDNTGTYRLPKTDAAYDQPFETGWPRDLREVESERMLLNAHGTIYEIGRESGYQAIRPVTTHRKKIIDFCTWRGLLVISGTRPDATADGHYFGEPGNGLWFGAIDDLWKMGKPRGEGGVWKDTTVKAAQPSLPFLMTGYDKKQVQLTADKAVDIALEIDFDLHGWHTFHTFHVQAGKPVTYHFPEGFSAHWVRAVASKDCTATVWFKYE